MRYELTIQERDLIVQHRRKLQIQEELKKRQETCEHNYVYSGHGHNDEAFSCTYCGKIEWR